jgi:hypothetical protein
MTSADLRDRLYDSDLPAP